jgi:hypothetical protein
MDPRLETLQSELSSVTEGLSPEQLSWRLRDKWCAAEILEHLYLTYTGTMKGFSRILEAGQPKVTTATWKQRVGLLVVLAFGYFPPGRESPPMARPRGLPPEKVRSEIAAKIADMDAVLTTCEKKFGLHTKILDHVILGPLTIAQWRKFHLVHGRHHIKQIQSLRRASKIA